MSKSFPQVVIALSVAALLLPGETIWFRGSHVLLALLWCLALLGWAGQVAWQRMPIYWHRGDLWLAAFLSVATISACVMLPHGNGRATLNVLWAWLSFGIQYWLTRQWVRDERAPRLLCAAMIAAAAGLAALGVYQRFYVMPQEAARYQRNPEAQLKALGLPTESTAPQRIAFENRLRTFEPSATFGHPNSLGGYVATWLMLAACALWPSWRSGGWVRRLFCVITIGVMVAGMWFTHSRAAILACGIGVAAVALKRWWPVMCRLSVGFAAMVGIGGLVWFSEECLPVAAKTLGYRLEYWRGSWHMITSRPWLGCGVGNFQESYAASMLPTTKELIADPHNFLVEITATAGVPAAGLFLAWLAWLGRRAISPSNATPIAGRDSSMSRRSASYGLWAAMVIGLAAGFLMAQMIRPMNLLLGLPAVVLAWRCQRRWAIDGQLARTVLATSGAVLLLYLLVSGGISFPGIGQSVWLIAALLANHTRGEQTTQSGRVARIGAPTLAVGFSVACYSTLFAPAVQVRPLLAQGLLATESGDLLDACARFQVAARRDRWSPEPCRREVDSRFQVWLATRHAADWLAFERAAAELRRRDPRSPEICRWLGDMRLVAYRRGDETAVLAAAIDDYHQAIARHPTNARYHAQLAWLLSLSGDAQAALAAASRALELDALHAHREHKLAALRLFDAPAPTENAAAVMSTLIRPANIRSDG